MKAKNNRKGITFMALVATIIVALILMTTVVISYSSFTTSAKKKAFANEISTIEMEIREYKLKNGVYPLKERITIPITRFDTGLLNEFRANSENDYFVNNEVELYIINFSATNLEHLARGTSENIDNLDMYAYSANTDKLYYLQGESIGDKTYYTYNDELYRLLKGIK